MKDFGCAVVGALGVIFMAVVFLLEIANEPRDLSTPWGRFLTLLLLLLFALFVVLVARWKPMLFGLLEMGVAIYGGWYALAAFKDDMRTNVLAMVGVVYLLTSGMRNFVNEFAKWQGTLPKLEKKR